MLALCLELLVLVPLGQTRFEAIVLGAAFVDHLDATVLAALFKCRHFGDALLFLRTVPHDFGYQDLQFDFPEGLVIWITWKDFVSRR